MPWTSPDDRLTPEEHDRFLAGVRERVRSHRRRRRMLLAGIGGLGIVLIAVTSIALVSGGARPQRLRTAGPPKTGPEPTAVGTAVTNTTQPAPTPPTVEPGSLSFINALDGWSLGQLCTTSCTPVLSVSRDGGATWTALPRPPTSGGIRFASPADGYLYAAKVGALAAPPATPGVFVTHDGGRTWVQSPLNGPVATIVVGARDDWAMVGSCDPSCSYQLFVSSDRGRSWQATSLHIAGVPATPVRSGPVGWVYVADPGTPGPPQLWYSGDDGRHWSQRSSGCPGADSASLAAASSEDLWLVCAGQPGAGSQDKTMLRSRDGGLQWQAVATSGLGATPLGSIPPVGYLSSIAAVSDQAGWMALDRGTMYVTKDGGVTWAQAPGWPPPELFFGDLQFLDRQHGWAAATEGAYSPGNGIYRTVDGGQTWHRIPL